MESERWRIMMKKSIIILAAVFLMLTPNTALCDECFEGDCENGLGKGFTEEGKVYEGEWRDGEPHGMGKLFISRDKILEGRFESGEFVGEAD